MFLFNLIYLVIVGLAPVSFAKLWPYQAFVTERTFHPPVLEVIKTGDELGKGLIVFTPFYRKFNRY
jgi:hypothetical protein